MAQILFGILVFVIYFFPSIAGYNHRNFNSICLLNLFLGWTLIGWVVALIWAFSEEKKPIVINNNINKSKSDELFKLKKLFEEGVLTQEEFDEEKKNILRK